jgi:hypothetical protein
MASLPKANPAAADKSVPVAGRVLLLLKNNGADKAMQKHARAAMKARSQSWSARAYSIQRGNSAELCCGETDN